MGKRLDKRHSERWHFKPKIRERYGVFCNRKLYWKIVDMIKRGESIHLHKQSCTRSLHRITLNILDCQHPQSNLRVPVKNGTVNVYLIYDNLRGELVTALPWRATDEEMLSDYYSRRRYCRRY